MTPVYAAPELFDGRPNIHSDQYSLAIVYQEMLTGSLPFEGRTTAQLAAQHLHSRPRLDRLPASDEPIDRPGLGERPRAALRQLPRDDRGPAGRHAQRGSRTPSRAVRPKPRIQPRCRHTATRSGLAETLMAILPPRQSLRSASRRCAA